MTDTTLTDAVFRPLVVPARIDAPDAADFRAMTDVRNRIYREIAGHDDDALPADELLPAYRDDPDEVRLAWVIVVGGEIVGRVGIDLPTAPGSITAFWLVELLRAHQGRGIGSAAYEIVERTAREHGRSILQAWAEHPASPGDRIEAPTGFGSIPRDRAARFFERHGYALEQIERHSILDLHAPNEALARLHADAVAAAAGYRTVQWSPPTPPEFAEGYGWMKSRMVTDAPAAGLVYDDEVWDAAHVARHDERYLEAGRLLQVTAAQHLATGQLVAFNELVIGKDRSAASQQEDTLVLAEHRGHRLGMLVKTAGLLSWRDLVPESPRVLTYNAEENRPMLDINEAIGFRPLSYGGAWKKVVR